SRGFFSVCKHTHRSLQSADLLPSRSIARSEFPPLSTIPHCCLPPLPYCSSADATYPRHLAKALRLPFLVETRICGILSPTKR
ncbi:4470_t:CDS:2, partial [Funneliformis geosporum]